MTANDSGMSEAMTSEDNNEAVQLADQHDKRVAGLQGLRAVSPREERA
jgi:hypothetical protein